LLIGHAKGIRIQNLCFLHQFIAASAYRIRLRIHDFVEREFHILCRELFSVVPEDSFSQKEGDDRFRADFDVPGFCQISHKAIQVSVVFDQSIEDEGVNLAGGRILGKDGVEKGGIGRVADNQLVGSRMGTEGFKDEAGYKNNKKEQRKGKKKNLNLQRTSLFCDFQSDVSFRTVRI
jgi:hypothetical protein